MSISYYFAKLMKKIQIGAVKDSEIDKTSRVCSGSNVLSCKMGRYSYIGNNCTVAHCEIGSFCSIADHCMIGGASHPMDRVTTSPVMTGEKNCMKANFSDKSYNAYQKTIVGNDVWIGDGCHIKSGVTLSDGCVIGMGSVVTKDVGPYEVWAGNPAKLIKKRFDDETIDRLLRTEWWKMSDEQLRSYAPYFNDPETFLKKVKP